MDDFIAILQFYKAISITTIDVKDLVITFASRDHIFDQA